MQAYTFVDTSIDRKRRSRLGVPQVARVIIILSLTNLVYFIVAPPSCTLISVTENPGDVTVLQCDAEGNPLPVVKGWTKDSTPVGVKNDTTSDYKVEKGETADTQKLLITNFGIQHFGRYQCLVSSKGAESSCTLTLTGMVLFIISSL